MFRAGFTSWFLVLFVPLAGFAQSISVSDSRLQDSALQNQTSRGGDLTPPRVSSLVPTPGDWIVDNIGVEFVQIGFDEAVIIPADAIVVWTVGGGVITDFVTDYNATTNTLTVTFGTPVRDDRLSIIVDYSVVDGAGNALDGEIANPGNASFPSGDGQIGGQAVFRINSLQGDANRDGVVDAADGTLIAGSLGACLGSAGFDANADVNGDGCINALDSGIFNLARGRSLPAADGVSPVIAARTPPEGEDHVITELNSAVIVFSEPIRTESIRPTSLYAVLPDNSLRPADTVMFAGGNSIATFGFNQPLPTDDSYSFVLSNAVTDAGGEFLSDTPTRSWPAVLVAPPSPLLTDSAVIIGHVIHAETGAPIQGAAVVSYFYPRKEGELPLPPAAFTDRNGRFELTTVPFEAETSFLIQIGANGFAENLRRVDVMAGRCWRVNDARLSPIGMPVMVTAQDGGMLADLKGGVTLEIPPGALMKDSAIGVTVLASAEAVRDELPQLVSSSGTFVDIAGVFGDETTAPVTMRVPNEYNLPMGTKVRFGKIDHNTLEWVDLRDAFGGEPPGDPDAGIGTVVSDGMGGTIIEVQFSHFCTVCTGYCLPFPTPNAGNGSGGNPGGNPGTCHGQGNDCGNSAINQREGTLLETIKLPTFKEMGDEWGITLGYSSAAANPTVTLSGTVDYNSTRPVERTTYEFDIEGVKMQGTYDASDNDAKPVGTFFWDGKNGLGDRMPTGTYQFSFEAESLNANTPVAISAVYGGSATQTFPGATYPGLTPLRSENVEGRAVLINSIDSPYGAGWAIVNENRLVFDPDGCVLLLLGNADWRLFEPVKGDPNQFISPDSSTLVRQSDGHYVRTFVDGTQDIFTPTGLYDRRVHRYGYQTKYTYASGRLIRITSPTGHFYNIEYNDGKLSRIVDSAGRETLFTVDASGDLTEVVDAEGSMRTFVYDADHAMTDQFDPRGVRTEYVYENGRVTMAQQHAPGSPFTGTNILRSRSYSPSASNGELRASSASGQGTLQNPINLVTSRQDVKINARGRTSFHETGLGGRTIRRTDAIGRSRLYEYDNNNRLMRRTREDGTVLEYEVDNVGNLTLQRDLADGGVTTFEFNGPFNQVSRVVDPEGKETLFNFLPDGTLTSMVDHDGNATTMHYEDARFPDFATRIESVLGEVMRSTFNEHGLISSATDPLMRSTLAEHDAAGNITKLTDPEGNIAEFSYDNLNRMTQIVDSRGATQLSYLDADCNCQTDLLSRITFPNNETIEFEFDHLNRMTRITDQLGRDTVFGYDEEDNLISKLNRNNEEIKYFYNDANQMVRKELPDGAVYTYTYDDLGYIASANNDVSQVSMTYDQRGLITQSDTAIVLQNDPLNVPFNYSVSFDYDLVGNLTQRTFNGDVVTYTYDNLHRPDLVTAAAGTWDMAFDEISRPTEIIAPNGAISTFLYDAASQITSLTHEKADTSTIAATRYDTYSLSGNPTAITWEQSSGANQRQYEYDDVGRLESVTRPSVNGAVLDSASYTYDDANSLMSDGSFTYVFDAEGRLMEKTSVTEPITATYTYDAENHLRRVSVVHDDGAPMQILDVEYLYDALGRRVAKSVNGVSTLYLYGDTNHVMAEVEGSSPVRSYVYAAGVDRPLAFSNARSGENFYYHLDRGGSVLAITDAAANVVQEYDYDAFGSVLNRLDPIDDQPFAFTGRMLDPETGLNYYRARYYDASIGRFLSEDASLGANRYAYVNNNPLRWTDPFGNDDLPWWYCLRHPIECAKGITGNSDVVGIKPVLANSSLKDIATTTGEFVSVSVRSRFGNITPDEAQWIIEYHKTGAPEEVRTVEQIGYCVVGAKFLAPRLGALRGISLRFGVHNAHHSFRWLGKAHHLQWNWWRAGVKGSGGAFRIPIPKWLYNWLH